MKKKAVCMLLTAGLGLASEFIPVTDNVLETELVLETESVLKTESIDYADIVDVTETNKFDFVTGITEIIPEEIPEIPEIYLSDDWEDVGMWQPPSESEPCTVYYDNGNMEIISAENPAQYEDWANRVENRNGKLVIDVIYGTVLDEFGNGEDVTGHYIKYDPERFEVGDMVETYLIYNPDNNALDGMEMRIDYLKEGEGF